MKYIIIKNGIFNELDRFDKILALVEDKIFELDDEPEHITQNATNKDKWI